MVPCFYYDYKLFDYHFFSFIRYHCCTGFEVEEGTKGCQGGETWKGKMHVFPALIYPGYMRSINLILCSDNAHSGHISVFIQGYG